MVVKSRILLAEDDLSLGYVIKDSLVEAGHDVVLCPDGQTAIEKFGKESFDICLLDVMMPNRDGFTVLKWIRQQTDEVPILMITARSMEEDRIYGFESGADDYICKPFSMKELLHRIDVFYRRTKKLYSDKPLNFEIGTVKFLFNENKLLSEQQVYNITQRESELLLYFCENPNRILTRKEILLRVWGDDDFYLGRSMDVFVTKLRKYLKPDSSINLETIHGTGFRFNANVK
jgi:DNA-binding response OmpR family regulator